MKNGSVKILICFAFFICNCPLQLHAGQLADEHNKKHPADEFAQFQQIRVVVDYYKIKPPDKYVVGMPVSATGLAVDQAYLNIKDKARDYNADAVWIQDCKAVDLTMSGSKIQLHECIGRLLKLKSK